jgi:hypothetical protein
LEDSGNVLPDVRTDPLASGTVPLAVGIAPELQEQPCQPLEQLNQIEEYLPSYRTAPELQEQYYSTFYKNSSFNFRNNFIGCSNSFRNSSTNC